MATTQTGARSEYADAFEACVAEYRAAVAELREIEDRMTRCVEAMRAEGAPRERLIAASVMVGTVRDALRASRLAPQAARRKHRAA
ncbi:MAG: hypothetical protein ACOX9R_17045 [Armatimonadota bacterium]|jgi:hypothetical protein